MGKSVRNGQESYVSADQLCKFLSISSDELKKLQNEGLPKVGKGNYQLSKVIKWLINYYRAELEEKEKNRNIRTVKEVAELFNVDERWINRLNKEAGLPKQERGKYDLKQVIPFYVNYLRCQIEEARHGSETESQARTRYYQIQIELKELELARRRGEIAAIEDLKLVMGEILRAIRDRFLTLPRRLAPELIGCDIADIEEKLEIEISKDLNDTASIHNATRRLLKTLRERNPEVIRDVEAAEEINDK
jgi:phage terminase Nu1 subunit (DNA packaging protein)